LEDRKKVVLHCVGLFIQPVPYRLFYVNHECIVEHFHCGFCVY